MNARRIPGLLGGLVLTALSVPTPTFATSESRPSPEKSVQHSEDADDIEGGHGHRHHLGAFLGGTSSSHGDGFTVGAEYEFRLQRHFALGVTAETVGGSLNENVVVGLLYFHPIERVALFGGGGWERRIGLRERAARGARSGNAEPEDSRSREPLGRIGALYEIPVGERVALSPNLSFDFVQGNTVIVYGVTVGFKF